MERTENGRTTGDLTAGICLVLAGAASVLVMAHHPTAVHGGGIGAYVHGAMMVLLTVLFYGFAHFARRRDLQRPIILAGLVAYGASLFFNLGAATINGFIVPALAARESGAVSHDIFVLCRETNQAFARLGVFATGAAYIFWSTDFLGRPGAGNRIIGTVGLLAGIMPVVSLAGGYVEMNVHGALAIYSAYVLWAVLVGFQFIRRGI